MSLSEKLQQLRKKYGWSQEYVSKVLNIDRSAISKYETGKSVPTYQMVLQLSEIYKVDKDYLVAELDNMVQTGQQKKADYLLTDPGTDPDLEVICRLAGSDKLVKDIFLELNLLDEKSRTSILRAMQAFIKEYKRK